MISFAGTCYMRLLFLFSFLLSLPSDEICMYLKQSLFCGGRPIRAAVPNLCGLAGRRERETGLREWWTNMHTSHTRDRLVSTCVHSQVCVVELCMHEHEWQPVSHMNQATYVRAYALAHCFCELSCKCAGPLLVQPNCRQAMGQQWDAACGLETPVLGYYLPSNVNNDRSQFDELAVRKKNLQREIILPQRQITFCQFAPEQLDFGSVFLRDILIRSSADPSHIAL